MKYDILLFDLDGTLSNPLPGIAACINHALYHFGHEPWAETALARFVGPPLHQSFREIIGRDAASEISALIFKYRERYQDIGFAENCLYDGVAESLQALHVNHAKMAICTSKPTYLASKILSYFGIAHYFAFISGGDVGIEKWQQIAELRAQGQVSMRTIMIGDRGVDLSAAHRHGLQSAAVLWGYGSLDELAREQPVRYFHHAREWWKLINC